MDQLPEIEREVELPAEAAEVWERIVTGEWMGVRIEPRPGGSVIVPDRPVIGTVEEIIPGERITWSWREIDGEPSQVTIEVTPTEGGSKVTTVERMLEYRITGTPPVFLAQAA